MTTEERLQEELALYGMPSNAGLDGLLKHIYASRDFGYENYKLALQVTQEKSANMTRDLLALAEKWETESLDNQVLTSCAAEVRDILTKLRVLKMKDLDRQVRISYIANLLSVIALVISIVVILTVALTTNASAATPEIVCDIHKYGRCFR